MQLAVVVPTFNERENVGLLADKLCDALAGIEFEVIYVDDDSPDGTWKAVRELSLRDPRFRAIRRVGRRGLSSACIEGMLSTSAPYIAVIDADLQHDETLLPAMLQAARGLDLVVASRYVEGGSLGEFSDQRKLISRVGGVLGGPLLRMAALTDPMSGFFLVDAGYLAEVAPRLSGLGFKILLDLVASSRRPVQFMELPYRFRTRLHGESKLDILTGIEYLQLLLDKTVGDFIPPKYVMFSLVGSAGAMLYLALFWVLLDRVNLPFREVQAIATLVTMVANFFLNNTVTYREQRLKGARIWAGLLTFCAACSIGAVITVRVAGLAAESGAPWYLGGLCGLAISSVWNYGVTRLITWRTARKARRV